MIVHPTGFHQSPYADVRPPGEDLKMKIDAWGGADAPRRLWHASPGSAGG